MSKNLESITSNASQVTNWSLVGVGALTLNQWLMIGGFALSLLTFVVNFYFQRQRNKMLEARINQEQFFNLDAKPSSEPKRRTCNQCQYEDG